MVGTNVAARERVHLWLTVGIVLALAGYQICLHSISRLQAWFDPWTSLPVAQWMTYALFFWLLTLLWLAYRRWRDSLYREAEIQRVISSISPDVMMVVSPERQIVVCTDSIRTMFGYESHEVVHRTTDLLYFDRRVRGEKREIYHHLQRFGFHMGEATGRRKDGSTFPVQIITSTLREHGGAVVLVRDVKEWKDAESALIETEKRYRLLVENAPVGVLRVSADGTIVDVNARFCQMVGAASVGDVLRLNWLTDPTLKETGVPEGFRACTESSVPGFVECWYSTPWKKHVYLNVHLAPILDSDDKLNCVQCIVTDMTERKHLEEQFLQAQKMEAVGRLAGGVAHDFNNLLTAILGYAHIARRQITDEAVLKHIEQIQKAGDRAANLTRQLLTFSRRQRITPRVIDVNAVILDMDKMLRRLVGADVELVVLPAERLGTIRADCGQVEQAVMNLVVNSRDAMPHGGRIVVRTANVDVTQERRSAHDTLPCGEYVVVSVSDTGDGIPSDVMEHIFEPFFSTKERGKGTGLGLATVYGIVKQSHGHVAVQSEVGKGTAFDLYFPRLETEADPTQAGENADDLECGHETVLLVEDEQSVRDFASTILEGQGYRVLQAANGEEALAVARDYAGGIDLLLSDVVMPRMGGHRLVESLRSVRPGLKVLLISGYSEAPEEEVREDVPLLQKPFTAATLARRVRQILDRA